MSYHTDITLYAAWDDEHEGALVREVERIAPDFAPEFRRLLRHGPVTMNDFGENAAPVFLRLSEAFPEDEFVLVGVGETLEEFSVWARKFARGRVYVRELASKWRRDEHGERLLRRAPSYRPRQPAEKRSRERFGDLLRQADDGLRDLLARMPPGADREKFLAFGKALRGLGEVARRYGHEAARLRSGQAGPGERGARAD
jgi:hypothetical protein